MKTILKQVMPQTIFKSVRKLIPKDSQIETKPKINANILHQKADTRRYHGLDVGGWGWGFLT